MIENNAYSADALQWSIGCTSINKDKDGLLVGAVKAGAAPMLKVAVAVSAALEFVARLGVLLLAKGSHLAKLISDKKFADLSQKTRSALETVPKAMRALSTVSAFERVHRPSKPKLEPQTRWNAICTKISERPYVVATAVLVGAVALLSIGLSLSSASVVKTAIENSKEEGLNLLDSKVSSGNERVIQRMRPSFFRDSFSRSFPGLFFTLGLLSIASCACLSGSVKKKMSSKQINTVWWSLHQALQNNPIACQSEVEFLERLESLVLKMDKIFMKSPPDLLNKFKQLVFDFVDKEYFSEGSELNEEHVKEKISEVVSFLTSIDCESSSSSIETLKRVEFENLSELLKERMRLLQEKALKEKALKEKPLEDPIASYCLEVCARLNNQKKSADESLIKSCLTYLEEARVSEFQRYSHKQVETERKPLSSGKQKDRVEDVACENKGSKGKAKKKVFSFFVPPKKPKTKKSRSQN